MRLRTLNEAADELNTTRPRLRRGIRDGRYPVLEWGNRNLVDVDLLAPIIAEEQRLEKMLSTAECAEQIGIPAATLRNMANKEIVPVHWRGSHSMCFDLIEVQDAIMQHMTIRTKSSDGNK